MVVTRYFGGIKLGAGGLVRAYAGTAAEALAGADIRAYTMCREIIVSVGYEHFDALKKFLEHGDADVKGTDYTDRVTVTVAVEAEKAEAFCAALTDRMAGRAAVKEGASYWFPFAVAP